MSTADAVEEGPVPRIDWQNFLAGTMLVAIGAFFLSGALEMPIGSARRMGPGYFPMVLAGIIILLGVLVLVPAFMGSGGVPRPDWRPFIAVLAGIAVFAVMMRPFGLVPAVIATVLVSALADRNSRPIGAVLLAVGLAVGSWLIFVVGLGLPMAVYRTPF